MFKGLFGAPKSPEDAEKQIQRIVEKELSIGVNGPAIHFAFEAAREKNKSANLGLTNNHLLNIVKDIATGMSGAIENSLYGGPEQTFSNIDNEIKRLREDLTEEEQGS